MSKIWITGATGAIGTACRFVLDNSVVDHEIYADDVDVRWAQTILKFLRDKEPATLVYAAGYNHLDWSWEVDLECVRHAYDVNVVGLLRCIQMCDSLNQVVVIGSDAARRPMRTSVAYNASKAALEAAVKVIARERAREGFVINIVAPGLVKEGNMTQYVYTRTQVLRPEVDLQKYMLAQIPAGRAAYALEVASVVQWLVEGAPSYLNGAVIDVNGAR